MKKSEDTKAKIISDQTIAMQEFSEVWEIFEPVIKLCNEKLAQCKGEMQYQKMQEAVESIVHSIQSQISELTISEPYEVENIVKSNENIENDMLPLVVEHKAADTKHFSEMQRTYNRYSYLEIATIAKSLMDNLGYNFPNQFEIVSNLQQFGSFVTNKLHGIFIDPLFIIYNDIRYDDHWLLICITKNEDGSFVSLYKDSKYSEIIDGIHKVLLSQEVRFVAHKSVEQDDANSCGPMALRNMQIMMSRLADDKQNFIQDFAENKKGLFAQQHEVQEIRRDFSKLIETEVNSARLETINQLNINGGEQMKANNTTTTSPARAQAAEVKDTNSEIRAQAETLASLRQATEDAALQAALRLSLESASTPARTAGSNNASVSTASNRTPEELQREALESFIIKEEKDALEAALRLSLESASTPARTAGSDNASVSTASNRTPEQVQRERLDALTETPHEQEILARVLRMSEIDSQTLPPPPNPPVVSNNTAPQASNSSRKPTSQSIVSLKSKIKEFINGLNFPQDQKQDVWDMFNDCEDSKEAGISLERVEKIFDLVWTECYSFEGGDDISVMGDL
jgi:hypothetical protein